MGVQCLRRRGCEPWEGMRKLQGLGHPSGDTGGKGSGVCQRKEGDLRANS